MKPKRFLPLELYREPPIQRAELIPCNARYDGKDAPLHSGPLATLTPVELQTSVEQRGGLEGPTTNTHERREQTRKRTDSSGAVDKPLARLPRSLVHVVIA